ncbi:MAG: hypothetical protein H0V89_04700 [Deltaproteobacteria bacterium]|nr:hypothetical protein [Deltaproteobacteria bacterium]
MSKRPVFTLPATGLELEYSGNNLSIRFDGDLVIEQTLGKNLTRAEATGHLTVKLPKVNADLRAGGTLTVTGDIDGGKLHGKQVVLDRQTVKCVSISALERIAIGPAKLQCDVIIAPEIVLDPKVSGRVTVVESANEVGPTKIKGGFTLADYEDTFANSEEFLAERGLTRLDGRRNGAGGSETIVPDQLPDEDEVEVEVEESLVREDEEETTDDPHSLSFDDMEPIAEPAGEAPTATATNGEDLHGKLSDALGKIVTCYEGADLPPAISELKHLVDQRDYAGLRQNITEVWNGLLGFHQKRGIRPHHQVTHAFNVIHGLVQE